MFELSSVTALWWAVIVSGLYHGLNPGMGWPLAVSAALMERRATALPAALGALGVGHFVSMTVILLPFSLMTALVTWQREIRIIAALLVIGIGVYLLINRRHPRFLARVAPTKLALWSFLAALAHGAGLMLVPIYLGMSGSAHAGGGHEAAASLMAGNIGTAFIVACVHTIAMVIGGGVLAILTYRWLGPRFVSQSWFNLDVVWALSLILVGGIGLYMADWAV